MAGINQQATRAGRLADGVRAGQALVELIVALVGVIVIVAAILQIGRLARAHTQALVEARREAGSHALAAQPMLAGPDYVADVTPGPDAVMYSRDDERTAGFSGGLADRVLRYGRPDDLDRAVAGNRVTALARSTAPEDGFGLVVGRASRMVTNLPVIRNLVYRADVIDVEAEVWLTWGEGIY